MKITILNSSEDHPINEFLARWIARNEKFHEVKVARSKSDLVGGDILFLVSCSEIIGPKERQRYQHSLVIHASDLPKGRGWSPHIWEIISGANFLIISLLEAADKVDSGRIWKKIKVDIPETALWEEINQILFDAELQLMDFAVANAGRTITFEQPDVEPTYWPRRSADHSELDIHKTIDDQFNLLRVCDVNRFPAFFYKNGVKFKISLEQINE